MLKYLKPIRMLVPFRRHYKVVIGQNEINKMLAAGWKPLSEQFVEEGTSNYPGLILFKRKRWWED